jgi:hypothetical protein
MGFLDNLENTLKAEEARAERDPEELARQQSARARELAEARAAEPYARELRDGAFTQSLLTEARTIGHRQRVLVRFTWVGDALRLEAKDRRVDLVPGPAGVQAMYFEGGSLKGLETVDLGGSAAAFAAAWLGASVKE